MKTLDVSKRPQLKAFLEHHKDIGFEVVEATAGFGRPCVGISKDGQYLEYGKLNEQTYMTESDCNVARKFAPPDAYHKHDCFAVLFKEKEGATHAQLINGALEQLEYWVNGLNHYGYILSSFHSRHPIFGPKTIYYVRDPEDSNIIMPLDRKG